MKTLLLVAGLMMALSPTVYAREEFEAFDNITMDEERAEAQAEAYEDAQAAQEGPWVPAEAIDLSTGDSRLGKAHNGAFRRRPAVRLFMDKVEGEPGSYYGVLFQYASLPSVLPRYAAARTRLNKVLGFLNRIGTKISLYKFTPAAESGSYEMHTLRVSNGRIEAAAQSNPPILVLAKDIKIHDPLGGAKIMINGKKKYSFPKDDGFWFKGIQYDLTRAVYRLADLDSTWRKKYLRGPYLAAYAKLDDLALTLASGSDGDSATFSVDPKFADVPVKKREKIYTNPKSAHIKGNFSVTQPLPGMFVLATKGDGQEGKEHVVNRIGLFIDIFDATRSLNQDVVELAFINPDDPKDFLMYYEHPDNGEGDDLVQK